MISITFTGDVAFTGFFETKCSESVIDDGVRNFLKSSDYVVADIETPITNYPATGKKIIDVVTSPKAIDNIVSMHMNIWNMCNNHLDDCGIDGIRDTLEFAEKNKCIPLGVGVTNSSEYPKPLIIDTDDCKVGILSTSDNYCNFPFVLTWKNNDIIERNIREIRNNVNYIVVVFHEGREFSTMPTPKERERYLSMLDMGADIVVAHHPHVIQNYEKVGDKIIFYSLGNFIFDIPYMREFNYTDLGMLLKFHFGADKFNWEYLPVKLDRTREIVCSMDLSAAPPIFRNIDSHDYSLMFPLAAKYLRKNEGRIEKYIKEHPMKTEKISSPIQYAKKVYRKLRTFFSKHKMMLRICTMIAGVYRFSKHRDLHQYISNSYRG